MKAIVINGTMRKGSTYNIAHMILNNINGMEITDIFLPGQMPNFCRGCYKCIFKDEKLCPDYQYTEPIKKAILEADIIVIASPAYVFDVTGEIKAFLDHFAYMWMSHRPEEAIFNKIGLGVTTAAGAGMRAANKTILRNLKWWGIKKTFAYSKAVMASSFKEITPKRLAKIEKETSKLAKKINKVLLKKDQLKPPFTTRLLFGLMRGMKVNHPDWGEVDSAYWKEKGFADGKKPWIINKVKV